MNIILNDKKEELPEAVKTVSDLVKWKEISPQGTAVAVNDKLIRQQQWESELLKEGDEVTIISAAYGG